jgi:chloride channel 3/4/5
MEEIRVDEENQPGHAAPWVPAVGGGFGLGSGLSGRVLAGLPFQRQFRHVYERIDGAIAWLLQQVEDDAGSGEAEPGGGNGGGRFATYEEFDSIDWMRDQHLDRREQQRVRELPAGSWRNACRRAWWRVQGWVCVTLVGLVTGLLAASTSIGTDWLTGTREGLCRESLSMTAKQCCRGGGGGEEACTDRFASYGALAGLPGHSGVAFALEYAVYVATAVVYAGLAGLLVRRLARYAAGSGIAEVKTVLGGFVIRSFASWQTLLVKACGLVLSVSSGLQVGKEGPMVHLAFCCGDLVTRCFSRYHRNEAKKREVLSAAAAAGISVAFGAPIGGVLFSLEEASYYFPHRVLWRAFYCAAVAALVVQFLDPYGTGKLVLFQVRYSAAWRPLELLPFALLGVAGGLLGAFIIRMHVLIVSFRRQTRLRLYALHDLLFMAALTALCSYLNDYTRAPMTDLMALLFDRCPSGAGADEGAAAAAAAGVGMGALARRLCDPAQAGWNLASLLLAFLVRLLLTVLSFGLPVPAGVFVPSLAIGACLGRAVGLGMEALARAHPLWPAFETCASSASASCVTPGVYSIIGAAAVLGGVTRLTVSLVVIMFELTGNLDDLVPIMLTVLITKWVGEALARDSIYEEHILLNRYPFLDNKWEPSVSGLARHVMRGGPDLLVISTARRNTVRELRHLVDAHPFTGFPVVATDQRLLAGFIARAELRAALDRARAPDDARCIFTQDELDASTDSGARPVAEETELVDLRPWMDLAPIQVPPEAPLNTVFDLFKRLGLRYVLVCKLGRLLGIITKKDLLLHIAAVRQLQSQNPPIAL